jgi:sodium transport system permease protein
MSRIRALLKKELLEALRDKRALLTLLFLPVIIYPGMLLLVGTLMTAGKDRLRKEVLVMAAASDDALAMLQRAKQSPLNTYVRITREEGERRLKEKEVWAVVDAPAGSLEALNKGEQAKVTLLYTKRHDRSREARERLEKLFEEIARGTLTVRLEEAKLPASWAEPVVTKAEDVDFGKDLGPLIASQILPIILVVMLFMGAMYPAVDATAGEKERGTLETLLVAPVRPIEVMTAKYVTVVVLAMLAVLANLAAMGTTFAMGVTVGDGVNATMRLTAGQIFSLLACLLPAAILVSGLALSVASIAKSVREGQNLMAPLVIVGTVPGLVAMMPGVELNAVTALVPLLNLALLVKSVALSSAQPLHVALTALSTLAASAVGLWLSANAFQSEALRFGAGGGWDLFGRRGR